MIDICSHMTDLDLFFGLLKGRCHGNQLKSKNLRFFAEQSTLLRCHSETDCNIAIPISKD